VNIYAALSAVMADVDHVAKRDRNEQQRFLFRGVDAVVNAVGPVLRKHHVLVIPQTESVDYAQLTTRNGGSMTSCRVVVTYTFYAEDGSNISSRVAAESFDSGDKSTPKAMSVAFRTALLQALALPTDEPEPDGQTYDTGPPERPAPPPPDEQGTRRMSRPSAAVTPAQLTALHAAFTHANITDREERLAYCVDKIGRPITTSNELTKAEASRVLDALKSDGDS
jgi:hypothetical protein